MEQLIVVKSWESNNRNTGYSNYMLNTGHTFRTMADIITIGRKGKYLNVLEKYHIYEISRDNLHMTEIHVYLHTPPHYGTV
jgi:hypothetical protein